jgi:hypothetical protein
MATLISIASGNFTSSSTWAVVDSTSMLQSTANTVTVGTSNIDSQTFTPGAITVDGVAVLVSSRSSSPGSNTFTVTLRNSTDSVDVASVTVNVSDVVNNIHWMFLKFSSPQTLTAGKSYLVRCVASASSMVTLYRDATANNVCRMLRTTTTAAPAANDQFNVLGQWTGAGSFTGFTVTMDNNSSTSFGPTVSGGPPFGATVNPGCTLTWKTDANTKLVLKGILRVSSGATLNIGTEANPIGSGYTAEYVMDCVANVDSGLDSNGTVTIVGATKTNVMQLLAADASAGGSTLTVSSTSGWAAGDQLAIAGTRRSASENELRTISTVDSGTQVTLSSTLTYPHSGTSPTQAEVINLTRNVKVHGNSTSLQGYLYVRETGSLTCKYAEFYYLGSNTGTKYGIAAYEGSAGAGMVVVMQYCSLYSCAQSSWGIRAHSFYGSLTVQYLVEYATTGTSCMSIQPNAASGSITISDVTVIGSLYGPNIRAVNVTPTRFRVAGSSGTTYGGGITCDDGYPYAYDDIVMHSCAGQAVYASGISSLTLSNAKIWRNNSYGINPLGNFSLSLSNVELFGNANANIRVNTSSIITSVMSMNSVTASGETSYSTPYFLQVDNGQFILQMVDCDLSGSGTGRAPHSTADFYWPAATSARVMAYRCKFGSTVSSGTSNLSLDMPYVSGIYSMKHNQVAGDHRRYLAAGTARTSTSIYKSLPPSEQLTPASASRKLRSGGYRRGVANGAALNVSVWVYVTSSYTGTAPRLRVAQNYAIGITADTTLATFSGSTDTWVLLTATSPTASGDDGVMEFYVDCDGTAGSVYVDDWSATEAS